MAKKDTRIIIIFAALIVVLYFILHFLDMAWENHRWNDGVCKCGGQLEHIHTEERYSLVYIYKCNSCGEIYEFSKKR